MFEKLLSWPRITFQSLIKLSRRAFFAVGKMPNPLEPGFVAVSQLTGF